VALADRVVLIEEHQIALDERVALARPRARGAAFDAIEERVLQRVLSQPGDESAPPAPAVPAGEWRWAI
jgi:sulfonate transport system ATP-binding protein